MFIRGISAVLFLIVGIAQLAHTEVLNINYGANNIDINADGIDDLIVKSRWENGNAHSFDRFYTALASQWSKGQLYEVSVSKTGYDAPHFFETRENVGCLSSELAHTVKIVFEKQNNGKIVAKKFFLESGSYAEKRSAFMEIYHLTDTVEEFGMGGNIGAGLHFWKKGEVIHLKGKYCDVKKEILKNN